MNTWIHLHRPLDLLWSHCGVLIRVLQQLLRNPLTYTSISIATAVTGFFVLPVYTVGVVSKSVSPLWSGRCGGETDFDTTPRGPGISGISSCFSFFLTGLVSFTCSAWTSLWIMFSCCLCITLYCSLDVGKIGSQLSKCSMLCFVA